MSQSALNSIPVAVEVTTGNVEPLLHEVSHALERLLAQDRPSVIDLRGLPLSAGDEKRLDKFLGRGELHAEVRALGRTLVWETRFAGVWMVVHHNANGEVVGKFIEVVRVPEILRSQSGDMAAGLDALRGKLEE